MLTSPLYKYVANPPAFAYMPPVLGGASICVGMFGWFFSLFVHISPAFAIILGLILCGLSAIWRIKEPQIHAILMLWQKFTKPTKGIIKNKGKFYVG